METSHIGRSLILASVVIIGGSAMLVMLGWLVESQALVRLQIAAVPMVFNTALCFLLCAVSLAKREAGPSIGGAAFALFATAIGFLTFTEQVADADWGVSFLFVRPFSIASPAEPGRMAFNTSIGFMLSGSALAVASLYRRLPAPHVFGVALVGCIVAAIGAVALVGYATGVDTATLWGVRTRMAVHTAACFVFLGIGIVLLAARRTELLPLSLPVPVFVGIIAATLSIAQAIRAEQVAKAQQTVKLETRYAARAVDRYLTGLYQAVDRIGELWVAQGGMPRALWETHAAAYLRDFPVLNNLNWADAEGQLRWITAPRQGSEAEASDLARYAKVVITFREAIETNIARVTPTIRGVTGPDNTAFLYIRPLRVGDRNDGALVAIIDTADLFKTVLGDGTLDRFSVTVTEGGAVIFTNSTSANRFGQPFEDVATVTNLHKAWRLTAGPKPDFIARIYTETPYYVVLAGVLIASLISISVFLALRRLSDGEAIRRSEERLALAVSGTSDGLWDWDISSGQVFCSPRFLEILGYRELESTPTAKTFMKMILPEDRDALIAAARRHLRDRTPLNVTFRVPHRDGRQLWLNLRGQAAWDCDGKPTRMTGFATDVSRDKEVEKLKGEFVANVSHELRTPLTSIRGALALIRSGVVGAIPTRLQNMADIAQKNCERLILLINDILDIDTIESGQTHLALSEQRLNALLQEAVEANRATELANGIQLVFEPVEPEAFVEVDTGRLAQAFTHLISNALKYSPAGGVVTVSAARREGRLRVCVTDQGPGIPEHFHPLVFAKFAQADGSSTRKQPGTGVGLNVTQKIIKRLGGEIGFDTEVGKGTTFWFDLPELIRSAAVISLPTAPQQHKTMPVLICEDDVDAACALEATLLKAGIASVITHSLAEARQRLAEQPFQALLLDLQLPDGNGTDLIRWIRANQIDMQIIVTAIRTLEARAALNDGGIGLVDWLRKDMDPAELLAALRHSTDHQTRRPRILHIEDDPDLRAVIIQLLGDKASVVQAASVAEALHHLTAGGFDLIILDLTLPDGSGLTLLERLGSSEVKLPVLILSANEVEDSTRRLAAATLVKSRVTEEKVADTIAQLLNAS